MDHVSSEDETSFIILAHEENAAFRSSKSQALHRLGDVSLIGHALRKAEGASVTPIIVVANARNAAMIKKVAEEVTSEQVILTVCSETTPPIQAIAQGLELIDDDITGNIVVFPVNMPLLETEDTLASMQAMLQLGGDNAQIPYVGLLNKSATMHPPVICANAQWLLHLGRFLRLSRDEQDDKEKAPWIRSIRKAIGTHYLDNPSNILIRLCTVGYSVCAARESDMIAINSRAALAEAEKVLQARLIKKHQLAGVTFRDPAGTFLSLDTTLGMDTEVGVGVQIYGKTQIGASCLIEGPTVIRDCMLKEGVYIRSHSVLEGAYISENSGTGPFARLREGTRIGPSSYIGNFVEIKNTDIGRNTLACHLTYLGDTKVGSHTNVGAGTITCNFNGFTKNRTDIGDHAFIGSHSTLVAPVSIGNGAVIAAGSVITNDAPADSLCFGRAKQVVKQKYAPQLRQKLRDQSASI